MSNHRTRWIAALLVLGLALGIVMFAALSHAAGEKKGPAMAPQVRFIPMRAMQMYEVYTQNAAQGRATFITSDSVLHTAHVLIDYTLRAAEVHSFDSALRQLTSRMLDHLAAQAGAPRMAGAPPFGYDRLAAYFGVAQQLLNPQAPIPAAIRPRVEQEVALILAHHGSARSPIMGVQEDYTQYAPRGHYTRNEQLAEFFRAMMWYGRAGFPISGEKSPGVPLTPEEARTNALAGIVLSRTLAALVLAQVDTVSGGRTFTAMDLWQQIYQPTAFLVGRADDLTPPEYLTLSERIFGTQLPTTWTEAEQAQTDRFIAAAVKLRPPQIIGNAQAGNTPPVALRLMGQRLVPDSVIFQQLVNPHVPGRNMPSGLDVMAVLGSPTAETLLRNAGTFKYPRYAEQLQQLRHVFAGYNEAAWSDTAYLLWLHTLQPLVNDPAWSGQLPQGSPGSACPSWWQEPNWQLKQLNAGLGSWAELRHDTLLYAKQSYTTRSARPVPHAQPAVYVEPVPAVYDRLIRLLTATRTTLTAHGVFPAEMGPNYDSFITLLHALLNISRREVMTGERSQGKSSEVTAADWQQARAIGATLKGVETLPDPLRAQITGSEDAQLALVADVHTDPNSGQVLEVAVGQVMTVVAPVPANPEAGGTSTVDAYGPIFSYYQFTQPQAQRLTDAAWQQRLQQDRTLQPFVLPVAGQ